MLLLTDVTDEEVTIVPADVFDVNPLNTDVVDAGVDDPNVDVIDGKATTPKVVVAGSVVVVTSGSVFFITWPPNIGVTDNEVGGTWVAMDPKLNVASDVVIFSMVAGLMGGISIDLR